MKLMNLYFYTFYRLYKRLQINPWGAGTYHAAIITLALIEVWILHCLLGNVALFAGSGIISDHVMMFFTPASFVIASVFTYVTIYRHFRGHQCIILFDTWPGLRHKIAGIIVRGVALLLGINAIVIVQSIE